MATIGMSHNALYVRDLDKSLHFYRDLLGMRMYHQATEDGGSYRRRAAYLDWEGNDDSFKLVIAQYLDDEYKNGGTDPTPIDHFSFWGGRHPRNVPEADRGRRTVFFGTQRSGQHVVSTCVRVQVLLPVLLRPGRTSRPVRAMHQRITRPAYQAPLDRRIC